MHKILDRCVGDITSLCREKAYS
uniref:Uncharacterized protein n=1 Tax=Arundo donax TaxID=35708 RepID=A0A0A9BDR6_ARUDO